MSFAKSSSGHPVSAPTEDRLAPQAKTPFVFVSHDTRDADVAEAFSKLLGSVTAGVLKCFRSSDKRGGQGIEYGVEWFPELMKKLQEASDVVCLLTENSIHRPWILFEAGVAKGKLDTPILGLAIGIPLSTANTGPFAQFQNSDDEEDALVKLVMQLVRKIPGADPDETIVRQQVQYFRTKIPELLRKRSEKAKEGKKEKDEEASVAKLFEEIKVMFNDLPMRFDANQTAEATLRRRRRKVSHEALEEIMFRGRSIGPHVGFIMILSLVREELPWLYDLGNELVRTARGGNAGEFKDQLMTFHEVAELTFRSPFMRQMVAERPEALRFLEHAIQLLHGLAEDLHVYRTKTKKV